MPCLYVNLLPLNSTQILLDRAGDWNDLWLRSQCTWPTMRAEPLAQWFEHFEPKAAKQLLVIEQEGRWVAALPLYTGRVSPLSAAVLPGGDLCSVGDLLLDESLTDGEVDAALNRLVDGLCRREWSLARFDAMFPATNRWQRFLAAAERRRLHQVARGRGVTGVIELRGSWEEYVASRSRNFRRQMRVARKRAESEGTLDLLLVDSTLEDECESLLRRGFEVEDRSWKAEGGTSTLRTDGAFPFFLAQAKLLLQSGHLLLSYLTLDGQPIAFEYGWQCKGTYHSLKVGYDEGYSHLSPGQLLRCRMLETFFAEGRIHRVDFLGPLSEATAKWATETYPVSRLSLGTHWLGKLALAARQIKSHGDSNSQISGSPKAAATNLASSHC
jgi:CelD/BcsL family acetyltransferase involved in cellulose biosynthesis